MEDLIPPIVVGYVIMYGDSSRKNLSSVCVANPMLSRYTLLPTADVCGLSL